MQPVSEELAQPASSSYFFYPGGNPGIWDPSIATETTRFAALQAAHGNDFIQIRGKRLELFAQMEVLQQTLSDGNAELNTFDRLDLPSGSLLITKPCNSRKDSDG